jgi:hypothetical protein
VADAVEDFGGHEGAVEEGGAAVGVGSGHGEDLALIVGC